MLLALALVVAAVAAVRGMWSPCGLSMLSSLNPVSEAARGHRFWVTALWYLVGAVAGGAVLGAGLAVAAFGFGRVSPSGSVVWTCALVAAAVAVASDTRIAGRSLPVHPRQVDERWLTTYRRWIYASGYGVQIGTGFATYIMTAAVYLTAVLAILTGSPVQAFGIGVAFGAVRGLGIGLAAFARSPEQLRGLFARVDGATSGSAWVATAASAAVATAAGWTVSGPVGGAVVLAVLVAAVAVSRRWAGGLVACAVPAD